MDPYRVKGRVKSMSIAMTTWCSWSFNTTNLSDAIDVVERLKHARTKNWKWASRRDPRALEVEGEITQCVGTFMEVAKSFIGGWGTTHTFTDRRTSALRTSWQFVRSTCDSHGYGQDGRARLMTSAYLQRQQRDQTATFLTYRKESIMLSMLATRTQGVTLLYTEVAGIICRTLENRGRTHGHKEIFNHANSSYKTSPKDVLGF